MKVLWLCGLPFEIQQEVLGGRDHGAYAAWSWILGHLPPPEGIELHIACRTARHTEARDFTYRGAHFHLVPVRTRARVFCLFQFDWRFYRDLATRLEPDVIHGWGTEDAYSWVALRLAPERHLIQVQGSLNTYRRRVSMPWPTWFAALSERLVLARARHVVAENAYALDSVRPMLRTSSAHVVEHPIRDGFLTVSPSTGEGRQVLFVGAIDERKGIWDALDAFGSGAPPDWRLAVVGNGLPGIVDELHRRMGLGELKGQVVHHPRLDTAAITAIMRDSSVFLLPTRIDTGPTALKEALAMGLWPVCYDNSGPAHYIRQFEFGSLARDLDPVSLKDTLGQAVGRREWLQPTQRSKVESIIRPRFARDRIWADLMRLYRRILENDRA